MGQLLRNFWLINLAWEIYISLIVRNRAVCARLVLRKVLLVNRLGLLMSRILPMQFIVRSILLVFQLFGQDFTNELRLLLQIVSLGILQTYSLNWNLLHHHLLFSFGVDHFRFRHSIQLF